jgi:hypothetical protein
MSMSQEIFKPLEMTGQQEGEFFSHEMPPMMSQSQEIGRFGKMRNQYLKEYKPELLMKLIFEDKINQHLAEMDQAARNRLNQIMAVMLKNHPAPDRKTQPIEWEGYMKELEAKATEIVLQELIIN